MAALDSITIRPPDEDKEGVAVFGRREFRYPHVLGGNAGNSYEHYRSWLSERALVAERLPFSRRTSTTPLRRRTCSSPYG